MNDKIEKTGNSIIQHGKLNNRIYLLKLDKSDMPGIVEKLDNLARKEGYTKIFTKIEAEALPDFILNNYSVEAYVPKFYNGKTDCVMASKFLMETRKNPPKEQLQTFFKLLISTKKNRGPEKLSGYEMKKLNESDAVPVTHIFKKVFKTYPFPVHDPDYIVETMRDNHAKYFGVWDGDKLIGIATSETDFDNKNAEMTDFAVLPEYRGKKLALHLLNFMEQEIKKAGIKTTYTIARLAEPGMNKTFLNAGYKYSGTLINNTNIAGNIESMNVFYKHL